MSFIGRVATNLAALRPLILAPAFDIWQTLGAERRVATSMTVYSGLDGLLEACPATTLLAPRLLSLASAVQLELAAAFQASPSDAVAIRGAAERLFGLLPTAIELSADLVAVGTSMGRTVAAVDIPEALSEPVGSLPPLPTPVPSPRPTSKPTPRPTSQTGSSGPSTGKSGTSSTAYLTASRYLSSVNTTYRLIYQTVADLWGLAINVPGLTKPEVDARKQEARYAYRATVRRIGTHLSFIASHPVGCLREAYIVDKALVVAWRQAFESYNYPGDLGPEQRAATYSWNNRLNKTDAFIAKLKRYVADC